MCVRKTFSIFVYPQSDSEKRNNFSINVLTEICTMHAGVGVLERYGWVIVFGLVILAFLWTKLKPYWRELQNKWERQREIANFGE